MNLLGENEHFILTSLKYSITCFNYMVIVIAHKGFEAIVLIL